MLSIIKLAKLDAPTIKCKDFRGKDSQWDTFRTQFRDFCKDKGWLPTLDHALGPSSPDFDHDVNSRLFTQLRAKTSSGAAYTFVNKAAEYDGWNAWRELLKRFDTHTEAQKQSLKSQAT